MPAQEMLETKLADQPDRGSIGGEQVVVELLQPDTGRDLEAAGEAARHQLALEQRHRVPPLGKPERGRETEGAATDHAVPHRTSGAIRALWRRQPRATRAASSR